MQDSKVVSDTKASFTIIVDDSARDVIITIHSTIHQKTTCQALHTKAVLLWYLGLLSTFQFTLATTSS